MESLEAAVAVAVIEYFFECVYINLFCRIEEFEREEDGRKIDTTEIGRWPQKLEKEDNDNIISYGSQLHLFLFYIFGSFLLFCFLINFSFFFENAFTIIIFHFVLVLFNSECQIHNSWDN